MSELPINSAAVANKGPKTSSRKPGKSASKSARSRAREFALQALYQVLVGKNVNYYIRKGKHEVNALDWDYFLKFIPKVVSGDF